MMGAACYPNPTVLLPLADLDEAAVSLVEARKWAQEVETIARKFEASIAQREQRGEGSTPKAEKWRNVLLCLRGAQKYALEHVERLEDARNRRARKRAG